MNGLKNREKRLTIAQTPAYACVHKTNHENQERCVCSGSVVKQVLFRHIRLCACNVSGEENYVNLLQKVSIVREVRKLCWQQFCIDILLLSELVSA